MYAAAWILLFFNGGGSVGGVTLTVPVVTADGIVVAPTLTPGGITLTVPVASAAATVSNPGIVSQSTGTAPANVMWFGDFL